MPPTSTPIFPSSSQQAVFEPFGIAFHSRKGHRLLYCPSSPGMMSCCLPPCCSPAGIRSAPAGRGAASLAVVLIPKRAKCQNQNKSQNNPASKYFFFIFYYAILLTNEKFCEVRNKWAWKFKQSQTFWVKNISSLVFLKECQNLIDTDTPTKPQLQKQ